MAQNTGTAGSGQQEQEQSVATTLPTEQELGFDMASLLKDDEEESAPIEEKSATEPLEPIKEAEKPVTKQVEVKKEEVKTEPIKTEEVKKEEVKTEVKKEEPVVKQEQQQTEQKSQSSTEQIDIPALRTRLLTDMEKQFGLTEEEAEQLDTKPSQYAPKLLARATMINYEATIATIFQALPGMVANLLHERETISKASSEADASFFSKYEMLQKPEFKPVIYSIANAVKQSAAAEGRQLTMEQLHNEVGSIAIIRLGLMQDMIAKAAAQPIAKQIPAQQTQQLIPPVAPLKPGSVTPVSSESVNDDSVNWAKLGSEED